MSMRAFGTAGAVVVVLAVLSGPGVGGVIRDDGSDADHLALAANYPSVGRVNFSTSESQFIASGTLIADQWVLTAAHVVDEAEEMTFVVGGQTYMGDKWIPHPLWDGDLPAGYDIALIKLAEPVTDVEPARRYRGRRELGAEMTMVGYGLTGDGLTGYTTFDGQKRAGNNVIDAVEGRSRRQYRLMLCDFDNPSDPADSVFGSAEPVDMEYLIAPGDSGGGAFIEGRHGPLLAGVNSLIGAIDGLIDCDYGDISGHTRVSSFNRWIDGVMLIDDLLRRRWGRDWDCPIGWDGRQAMLPVAEMIPEPVSLIVLSVGGLAQLRRRRG